MATTVFTTAAVRGRVYTITARSPNPNATGTSAQITTR